MAQTSLHSSLTTHTQSSLNEEKHLQVLVLEIVTLKKQSVSQKNRKLDQLIRCISRSAYLRGKGNYSSNIYDDALNRTFYWVVTHLEEYDPEKGRFMGWVNYPNFSQNLRSPNTEALQEVGLNRAIADFPNQQSDVRF